MDNANETRERPRRHLEHRASARDVLKAPSQYLPPVALDEQSLDDAAVPDPMREVIRQLAEHLFDEVILPTLSAETAEELFRGLAERLGTYQTTMSAIVCLVRTTAAGVAVMRRVERKGSPLPPYAEKIAGQKAMDEVQFAEETYLSAVRILARFPSLPKPSDLEEDQRQSSNFNFAATLFSIGGCMITAIGSGAGHATPVATEVAFELLRLGALDSYVAARTALALRASEEPECDDPLPFDEEDMALADA